jgi:hypothetical protein
MEKMPYQPELERAETMATPSTATTSDWRNGLPVLAGSNFILRELRAEDAPTLLAMLTTAVGLFQLRALEPGLASCEWGFALGSQFWGTGLFVEGAQAVLNFGVDVVGTLRFEARAAVANGRGNGALRKIGAVQEGVLRRSFLRNGQYHDQVLWSILAEDWRLQRIGQQAVVH